ncbi:hypothetical protein ACFLQL_01545 [Verrucomicrobiota bacterium]
MNTLVWYGIIGLLFCFLFIHPQLTMIMAAGGVAGYVYGDKIEPANSNMAKLLCFAGFFMPLIPLVLWLGEAFKSKGQK